MKDFNELLSRHPRKGNKWISYGTAGFRDKYVLNVSLFKANSLIFANKSKLMPNVSEPLNYNTLCSEWEYWLHLELELSEVSNHSFNSFTLFCN